MCFILVTFSLFIYISFNMIICIYAFDYVITLHEQQFGVCGGENTTEPVNCLPLFRQATQVPEQPGMLG